METSTAQTNRQTKAVVDSGKEGSPAAECTGHFIVSL